MWYNPESTLDDLIACIIDAYEQDRLETHGSTAAAFDEAADLFLHGASDFVVPPSSTGELKWTWQQAEYLMANIPHTRERLEIAIAHEFATGIRAKVDRCTALAELVLNASPNQTVLRFLKRLGRCYIAGFLPECVMVCRAVLENAIAETFTRHGVPLPATPEGASSMRSRVAAARTFNWLTSEAGDAALLVWQRGNTAVHNDPEATKDVVGTIRLTMMVLSELYAS